MIPYGRQSIDEEDIKSVVEVLRSDWLTTGPKVAEFEKVFSDYVGAKYAVAVSSGTAALHAAMYALGIQENDEVIVPPMTFAASANCIVYQGGTPIFVDVCADTLLINPSEIVKKITPRTKAIIAVDYAGHPCDYDYLREIADQHKIALIADGCHALGAEYKGGKVGSLTDMTAFSFHPVKHITTGEGGMIATDNEEYAKRMKIFRNHGITTDHRQREAQDSWFYEMVDLGYNYRMSDFQCALGISQLKKLPEWLKRRRDIAAMYNAAFKNVHGVKPLEVKKDVSHAYHLYVVRAHSTRSCKDRKSLFHELRLKGIGVNVHYVPVHLHPYYRNKFGCSNGLCPVAEAAYEEILSLPMHPTLNNTMIEYILQAFQ